MREFEGGATRDNDDCKIDPEGSLSPLVLERYSEYMLAHCIQSDGKKRTTDNWQKGIPYNAYMKSMWRHFLTLWKIHRRHSKLENIEETLCALFFNVHGYLHEILAWKNSTTKLPDSNLRNIKEFKCS